MGPYIKSIGTGGTKMSANADLITVETYVQQGKTIENQFFIYGPKCVFCFSYLRGSGGAFNDQTGPTGSYVVKTKRDAQTDKGNK